MLKNCPNLTEIHVDFSQWPPSDSGLLAPINNWVSNVASNGKFYCPADLPQEFGTYRIPTGWEVITEENEENI